MTISDLQQNQIDNSSTPVALDNTFMPESLEPATLSDLSELTTEAETEIQEPKKDIMSHLKQSNDDFLYFSVEAKKRSSKIREHIQKSLSWERAEISVL